MICLAMSRRVVRFYRGEDVAAGNAERAASAGYPLWNVKKEELWNVKNRPSGIWGEAPVS
jgi:hypothetical protein